MLREHFPQIARSHREEILLLDLEEIYDLRYLVQEEDEDDETETARTLSEREKRELFRQHRNLGHPQPTELARALRHAGARREATRFVHKEIRCPTFEARLLPLRPRPGMLNVLTNALALTQLTWKSEMGFPLKHLMWFGGRTPDCTAFADKLHREDCDKRVQNCLGEILWMAGDRCT